MDNLIFFVLGFLVCLVIHKHPLKFHVHHTHENIVNNKTEAELEKLQEKMLKEDPKNDKLFDEIDNIVEEINNIMGGSDRNG